MLAQYREKSVVLHRQITWMRNGMRCNGYVETINDAGNLVVSSEGTSVILNSGEVSVKEAHA